MKVAVLVTKRNGEVETLALLTERIRRRELRKVVQEGYQTVLRNAGIAQSRFVTPPAPERASWSIFVAAISTA